MAAVHYLHFRLLGGRLCSMESNDLTREQAAKMSERVGAMLGYLAKLKQRIDARHFPPDDKFRQLVDRAYDGIIRYRSNCIT